LLAAKGGPAGCEVSNKFSLLEPQEEVEDGPPELTDSEDEVETKAPVRANRWRRNASQRKPKGGCDNISILQEMKGNAINGCSETAKEWEELEFLVDSGASATVVGKDDAKAVKASEPDPSRHYKMADGSIIPHLGDKQIRAVADELATSGQYKPLNFGCSVADVDKPLLSVAQVVNSGGTVVFSRKGSYIDLGDGRRDQIEFRNGLYVLKLWVPRDQKMDFHGQA